MKNKGFTLFETLISIVIFGITSVLMFQMSSRFFQLFTTSSSKQSVNNKFIKAYKHMQKDLAITDSRYVYTYKMYLTNVPTKWMLFPIPTDNNGLINGEGNKFSWKRICFYYLTCSNSDCPECKKKNYHQINEDDVSKQNSKFCSDKNLIRLVYDYFGTNDPNYLSEVLSTISNNISSYTLPFDSNNFSSNTVTFDIKGYSSASYPYPIQFVEKRIIANDIMDMDIETDLYNITVDMSTVRKEDIKKEVNYGTTDFTTNKNSKFVEKINFIINSKNG